MTGPGSERAEVSEADRRRAVRLLVKIPGAPDRAAFVAAALAEVRAEERQRVLAPFEALADSYPLGSDVPVYRIQRAIEEAR